MTEFLRDWLLGIACAAMVLALAESVAPEGSIKRVCRLTGGLVLMLVTIGPITDLSQIGFQTITRQYESGAQAYQEKLELENDFIYESIIAERTAAYISDKAEDMGISCQVTVTVGRGQDGVPKPSAAHITGNLTQQQRSALRQVLESDLGIPPAMLHFEESLQ